jgi:hypothetical protein
VIAFDCIDYPMYGTLYHPEYMDIIMCNGTRFQPKTQEADEISLNLSTFVNKIARNNNNTPKDLAFLDGSNLVEYEIAPKAFVWVY